MLGTKDNATDIGVTTTELMKMIKAETVIIIDVRRPDELENEGKISGSVNIPSKLYSCHIWFLAFLCVVGSSSLDILLYQSS